MNKIINSLKILRSLGFNRALHCAFEFCEEDTEENFNDLLAAIYSAHAEENLTAYVQKAVLEDVNAFSLSSAEKGAVSPYVADAYLYDLNVIDNVLKKLALHDGFAIGKPLDIFEKNADEDLIHELVRFYRMNGYGQYVYNKAFKLTDSELVPIRHTPDVKLSDLKNYEDEKRAIGNNIDDFVNGRLFSHMLLYGDRGTGKSSTVHAFLNEYGDSGLRLIEIDKENLHSINEVRQRVALLPLKFIIFIDDLSVSEDSGLVSTLKSAVEGSVAGGVNTMIVATSNRRHIVNESFSERDNSVHPTDSIEENLSLSDRFGLTVIFSSTDKTGYLSIVKQLAADYRLKTPTDELKALAERWAIVKGGRSPRRANQFVRLAYSSEQAGRKIEF